MIIAKLITTKIIIRIKLIQKIKGITISGKADFDLLLTNLINAVEGIKATAIVDRQGLIIHSKLRTTNTEDDVIGSVTAVFDSFISRVKTEFGSAEEFLNIMTVGENKFTFAAAGPEAILTIISEPDAEDNTLKAFANHIRKKIKLLLEGERIDPTIPPIVSVLANMRTGKLPKGEYNVKLIVLGNGSVGKTSLVRRFVDDKFQEAYINTIGVDISKKTIELSPDCKVSFVLWDIAGQIQSMASYRARFYSGANCAFIQFSVTSKNSFESIDNWLVDMRKSVEKAIPIVLIANKIDLPNREVTTEMIRKKAESLKCHYIETSAKTGTNVHDAFLYSAYKFIENNQ